MERGWIFKRSAIVGAIGGISGLEENNFIPYFIALGIVALIPLTIYSYFFDIGGSDYQESAYYNSYDNSSTTSESNNYKNCLEPENPYGDGGGHDAGYKRAQSKGGNCNGNSDSFNEGCEEYYEQMEAYRKCVN